ncbi:hypothetical protein MKZ38_005836 [Zalerion maritima]|uniref:Translocase of outer membrane 40 kDa subunit n=1 Tax=Zalerion maritima TaxID=339359 RepID=A0AAD5RVW3_9PEZI|nr:hypothetical protein MKZ38_005836 [Zalerion maritima]
MDSFRQLAFNNPISATVSDVYQSFSDRRSQLGLSNPGTIENISKEVQRDVFLANFMFSGLRADINKAFSISPLFQVSHQFFMGERQSPYTFAAMYGTNQVFLQGSLDNDGSLSSRFNYRWGPSLITKTQIALSSQGDMAQFEHEYTGDDFTASLKMLNPSYLSDGLTGTFVSSYLQSVTPKLALGLESVWQRQAMTDGPQTAVSYMGRYRSEDWVASVQLQAQGALNTSYWRKLSDRVQAGVDINLSLVPSPSMMGFKKEGLTTLGAKYQFRMSTFRAQIDSAGKLAVLLEKHVAPAVMMTFAVDVDQVNQQAKLGIGISVESGGEELQEQQEALGGQGPNIPF